MIVGALMLAAGLSRRMGGAKLAMPWRGAPLIGHALTAADTAGLPLLVVLGGHESAVRPLIGDRPNVLAPRHAEGLGHSLAAGVAAAPADWQALLVLLADMPQVMPATLVLLAERLRAGAPAVVPVCGGRRGNPAGFARAAWPQLIGLTGDRGAGPLLDALGVIDVPVSDAGVLRDYDRPADFLR